MCCVGKTISIQVLTSGFCIVSYFKENMFKALFEIESVATNLKNKQRDVPR